MMQRIIWAAVLAAMPLWPAEDRPAAFYRAIYDNDLAALHALTGAGDVDVQGKLQFTPLHHAAAIGTPEAARVLIEAGANVSAKTQQGAGALYIAASRPGWAPVVKMLLDKGADPKAETAFGATALQSAARAGDLETVRMLLAAGADVNAADRAGLTPLLEAVAGKNTEVALLLIQRGANVNAANGCCHKVRHGDVELGGLTPLMLAVPFGMREVVRALLERGADVHARDVRGMTPLMLAAANETQDAAVVKMLLAKGADRGAHSPLEENAADWARKYNHPEVLSALGAHSAKPQPAALAATAETPRAAGEKALALLQRTTAQYFKQGGCFGCHHQGMTSLAVGEARARGWRMDAAAAEELRRSIPLLEAAAVPAITQLIDPPPGVDGASYAVWALDWLGHAPDATTDAELFYLAGRQRTDGSLRAGMASRSPLEEGDIHRTALMIRAFKTYAPPARRAEFDERIRRAATWLQAAPATTTDDDAMKLLGLAWAGMPSKQRAAPVKSLLRHQRRDGGWGGNPNLESDAYATGQALYALLATGAVQPSAPEARRAVRYLLGTQRPDGSWHVKSRAVKFQPYFESGFPHGHDQWVSTAGTAWAVMALARGEDSAEVQISRTGE